MIRQRLLAIESMIQEAAACAKWDQTLLQGEREHN